MRHYRLLLSYKGTKFQGWQKQPQGKSTVQSCLEDCLAKMCHTEEIKTLAAGRTDAGVHALGQVVKVSIPGNIPPAGLKEGLNALLERDIRVRQVVQSDDFFHPIRDANRKEYRYFFCFSDETPNPLLGDFVTSLKGLLDVERMGRAAQLFVGEHDFCNYYTVGGQSLTTIRKIDCSEIYQTVLLGQGVWVFRVRGEGFLKQMVRLMVGALFEVGRRKLSLERLAASLSPPPLERKLGPVAPARGLILHKVLLNESNKGNLGERGKYDA